MATDLVAVVHMNWGKWVAMCPRPHCSNGECFGRCDDGSFGGLVEDGTYRCRPDKGGCGLICRAQWPANVREIERVLLARPVPGTRHWSPGETLAELVAENIEHGLVPESTLDHHPLMVQGDDVTRGVLAHGFADYARMLEG